MQAHAAAALINFAEPCEAAVLQNHLQKLLEALKALLENGTRNVQEQAVTAIAGLAENSKTGFTAVHRIFRLFKMAPFKANFPGCINDTVMVGKSIGFEVSIYFMLAHTDHYV